MNLFAPHAAIKSILLPASRKKHLEHCNYDSAIIFKLAGVSLQAIVNLDDVHVPPIVNHCTAFNDRYTMFF